MDWLANHPAVGIIGVVLVIAALILMAGKLIATRIPHEVKDPTKEWFV
jgi:hypothetical protein